MRIQVHGSDPELTDGLHQHAERRLRFALGRFAERIGRVSVRFFDRDGPPDGIEGRCEVVVRLLPSGRIVTRGTGADRYAAIDWVADRTGRAVGREFARRSELGRDSAARGSGLAAGDEAG
jgi:putative sigma-54 modulation protein